MNTQTTLSGSALNRAAFEITKGPRSVVTMSEADVLRHIDLRHLLDALEDGFKALEKGEVQVPARPEIAVPGRGFSLAMPAWRPGMPIAVKVVNVFEGNLALGLPSHLAMIMLFDPDTGATLAVMDGTAITAMRTAASAVLSARLLARKESKVATIVGAGVQAHEHLRLLPLIGDFDRIHVCSLHFDEACRLALREPRAVARADVKAAVQQSDIVCLATHSAKPVIDAAWLRPGTHLTSVGYHPPLGELPLELPRAHRVFVETMDALEPPPVGCAELANVDRHKVTTLGAVALGKEPGRRSESEITVYKAMGVAMEDLVAANLAFEAARAVQGGGAMQW